MEYRPGTRLRSQVCDGQFIIVRAPAEPTELRCGGHPLIDLGAEPEPGLTPVETAGERPPLGKRYTRGAGDLEVLVTKPAGYPLSAGEETLVLLESKPLPSSD